MSINSTAPSMSEAQILALQAQLKALQEENQALLKKGERIGAKNHALGEQLSCRVSEKGAVSVYGIHTRFPITLYKAQWFRLFKVMANLRAFIEANDAKLSAGKPVAVKTDGTVQTTLAV